MRWRARTMTCGFCGSPEFRRQDRTIHNDDTTRPVQLEKWPLLSVRRAAFVERSFVSDMGTLSFRGRGCSLSTCRGRIRNGAGEGAYHKESLYLSPLETLWSKNRSWDSTKTKTCRSSSSPFPPLLPPDVVRTARRKTARV